MNVVRLYIQFVNLKAQYWTTVVVESVMNAEKIYEKEKSPAMPRQMAYGWELSLTSYHALVL